MSEEILKRLEALLGSDEQIYEWLNTKNSYFFGAEPSVLLESEKGEKMLLAYLQNMVGW